jgi:hypothetical protein
MNKKFIFLFALAFIFAINITAFADEGHSQNSNFKQAYEKFKNRVTSNSEEENEHQGHSNHIENNLDSSASSSHTDSQHNEGTHAEGSHGTTDNHSNPEESGHEGESGGHHGVVVETPPNYKVLGTYGVVNLSFILFGVWNKWFRREGNK